MWTIQSAFLLFTVRSISLSSLTSRNTSFLAWSVQMPLHVLLQHQHHTSKLQMTCTITKKEQRIKIRRQIPSTLDRRLRFVPRHSIYVQSNGRCKPGHYLWHCRSALATTINSTDKQPSFRSCYQPTPLKIPRLSWKRNFHYSTHKSTNGPHPESH